MQGAIRAGGALSWPTLFARLPRHPEAFASVNQAEAISADRKAFGLQNGMNLPVTEARIAFRQLVNAANQPGFLDAA